LNDTQVSVGVPKLFVVKLHTRGWSVGVSHTPEERVLTTFFRLSQEQRNRLQYLKVQFYRMLNREKLFMVNDEYVVSEKKLVRVERFFREIYGEFEELRREIYEELASNWDAIMKKLREHAEREGISLKRLEELKPISSDFLEMSYTVHPLNTMISVIYRQAEEFKKLSRKALEYKSLAERTKREAEDMLRQIRSSYNAKVEELEKTINLLKEAVKQEKAENYRLRLRAKAETLASEAKDIAPLLGEETAEDLYNKLDALKEFFLEH
jgi:CHASE3 domain sensor protein